MTPQDKLDTIAKAFCVAQNRAFTVEATWTGTDLDPEKVNTYVTTVTQAIETANRLDVFLAFWECEQMGLDRIGVYEVLTRTWQRKKHVRKRRPAGVKVRLLIEEI